jgi:hypothetical protein
LSRFFELVRAFMKLRAPYSNSICSVAKVQLGLAQRRSEDYTGMQRGQTRFFTYYWFLALRRHCSVGFRCVYTSRFREIQKRIYRKKL